MRNKRELKTVMILCDERRGFYRDILRGIFKYSSLYGPWRYCGGYWEMHTPIKKSKIHDMGSIWVPDGIITISYDVYGKKINIKELIPPRTPIIFLSEKNIIAKSPNVITDDVAIGEMAAEYLLSLGFKFFGYCGMTEFYWSKGRGESFSDKIAQAGFETDFYKRPRPNTKIGVEKEQEFIVKWLKSLPKPVGIMACNDFRSQIIIEAIRKAGLLVPDDVAVIGVDNDTFLCEVSAIPISSVALNAKRVGFEVAELLDKLMAGTQKKKNETIIVRPTHVVTRHSTKIEAIDDPDVLKALHFIHDHVREIIQVGDVVNATDLSRRILQKRFKKILDHTIIEEISRARVELISRILIETNTSVSNIALSLGFSDIPHMVRYFKKIKGITPLRYRNQYGQK